MNTKILSLFCVTALGLSGCVVDLSDDDIVRTRSYSSVLKEMSAMALEDCGRGNIKTVSASDYTCIDGKDSSSGLRSIEEIALDTCKGRVQEVTATGFVCK